jgi:hypothetical protein
MKNFEPGFDVVDGFRVGVDAVDGPSWASIRPIRGSPTASLLRFLGHCDGLLAGIQPDYDGATDLKRGVQIFIIGSSLAFCCSKI